MNNADLADELEALIDRDQMEDFNQLMISAANVIRSFGAPVAIVINNNQPGTQHIVQTPPNTTLDIGTELYRVKA